jgi:hypothetical protein
MWPDQAIVLAHVTSSTMDSKILWFLPRCAAGSLSGRLVACVETFNRESCWVAVTVVVLSPRSQVLPEVSHVS